MNIQSRHFTQLIYCAKPCGALLMIVFFNTACSLMPSDSDGPPDKPKALNHIQDAVPRHEPLSKQGNPQSYVVFGKRYYVRDSREGYVKRGVASWYGKKFHGRPTSSGEPYDMYKMTAAHKTLPLPSYVEIVNLDNQKRVVVRVNDRGPFHDNRIIDVSYVAAHKLGMLGSGTANVEVRSILPRQSTNDSVSHTPPPNVEKFSDSTANKVSTAIQPIFIQVGAFRDAGNATELAGRLNTRVMRPINIVESITEGSPLFLVRVGPIFDSSEISHIESQLADQGITQTILVIN